MIKVNLCCGKNVLEGYDNYDIRPVDNRVKYIDLKNKFPFKDNYIDLLRLDNGMEHIDINPLDLMNEINRVLKVHGRVKIGLPVYSPYLYHIRHNHTPYYFNCICDNSTVQEKYIDGLFRLNKINYNIINLRSFFGKIRDLIIKYTCQSLTFELEKLK